MTDVKKCGECEGALIPGEQWPENYQQKKIYFHKRCNQKRARGSAVIRRRIELGEGLSRAEYTALSDDEQRVLRDKYKGLPDVAPKVKLDRPTTKVHVPEPKWYTPTPKEKLSESPTRKALRRNKLVDFDACELSSYGPVADLEFHHTLDFAVCAHHYKRLDWAADINNGFLMIGCLNNPMKRGFHWEMDGPCAYYVPPEGEDYPDWMKVLRIPHFWIEPTPEQVKYILLASDHAKGIMY